MCTNKSDLHNTIKKHNYCYEPIFIAGNIKNITVIAHIVSRRKCFFSFGMILPIIAFNKFRPSIQGSLSI